MVDCQSLSKQDLLLRQSEQLLADDGLDRTLGMEGYRHWLQNVERPSGTPSFILRRTASCSAIEGRCDEPSNQYSKFQHEDVRTCEEKVFIASSKSSEVGSIIDKTIDGTGPAVRHPGGLLRTTEPASASAIVLDTRRRPPCNGWCVHLR